MEKWGRAAGAERPKQLWSSRSSQWVFFGDVEVVLLIFFLLCSWFLEGKDLKYEWIPWTDARFCVIL